MFTIRTCEILFSLSLMLQSDGSSENKCVQNVPILIISEEFESIKINGFWYVFIPFHHKVY